MTRSILLALTLTLSFLEVVDAGIIGHWSFEEGPLDSQATGAILDSSGNNLDMTPEGNPFYRSVTNPDSTLGLEFDGSGDLLRRGDSSLFRLTSLTIEAFIKWDGQPTSGLSQIFFRGDDRAGRDPYFLAINDGKLRFNISDLVGVPGVTGTDVAVQSTENLSADEWLHVAGTLNADTNEMKIYVNGMEVGQSSAFGIRPDVALNNGGVSIGGLFDGSRRRQQHFNGLIDEVRLSDVALTPDQFLNASASTVPEPASMALWGLGSLGMGVMVRRRQRQQIAA